ncbi:MAG: M23 family metallopeptidase [Chloroflexi bacterium]|nr:M23 family metallopeptidase [Chloroflexota bacterium]
MIEDTDYGVKNPDLLGTKICWGDNVPWSTLYHAGEDLYHPDSSQSAAGKVVTAIANGRVVDVNDTLNYPAAAIVIEHTLPSQQKVYSVYMHLLDVNVQRWDIVSVGTPLGIVRRNPYEGNYLEFHQQTYDSDDSHIHFEIRYFPDAREIYSGELAGCNKGDMAGRAYTPPDIHPDNFPAPGQGYTDPTDFINSHSGSPATPTVTPTASAPSTCAHWDLASEFRPSPDHENPNRDSCGNLVWEFRTSSSLVRDPLTYSLAVKDNFTASFQNNPGLNVWSGNPSFSWPFIGYNANKADHLWPLHSIQVHPSNSQLAIIVWKSPINGYVSVTGEVIDTHVESGCGNGIEWYIDKESTNLAYGGFENGGRQLLVGGTNGTNLNAVPVNIDERLYLLIDPKGVDYCDTTQVNLFIDATSAPATPTPLNGPTSTALPPNFTPPPTTPAIPTATPPPPQPTTGSGRRCTLINLLGLLADQTTNANHVASLNILPFIQQAAFDIQLFYRVEDEILSQTPQGQHYIDLYYGHGAELTELLTNNVELRDEAVATLQLWEPNLQALVDGEGGSAPITSGQVQAVQTFLDHLYSMGSPELRQTIDDERIVKPLEQTIGLPMNQASVYLVDHQGPPTATPTETSTPTLTPTNTATLTPTDIPANFVFANGFESGNFSAWDWTTTDGGDLSVSAQSAAVGSYGMSAFFDDGNDLVVYDNTPNNEKHYSARFYFDPNSMQMISEEGFYLLGLTSDAVGWSACIYFEQQGEYYSLGLCGKNDAGTWLKSDATLITDDWQAVEIEWQAASAPAANDGTIKLWIGDQLVRSIENIDSDNQSITSTMWGPNADTFAASGTMYFDAFASYKGDHIGLDPNGPAVSPAPARPDLMFADTFESGDLSHWNLNLSTLDGGDLSASALAAHQSNFGLQALIDDLVKIKLLETSPVDETEYHARFYFHPNSISMSSGSSHFIFEGAKTSSSNDVFGLELFYESGAYKLRPRLLKDSYSNAYGSKYTLSNNWHVVEIEWHVSTAPGANNGFLSLWIDDVLMGTISNVDNDTHRLDQVMLGVTEGVDSTTSGSMLFDQFESRRNTHIGP